MAFGGSAREGSALASELALCLPASVISVVRSGSEPEEAQLLALTGGVGG